MKRPSKTLVGAKLKNETREFIILAAYLFVCFAAVSYMKFAVLKAQGVDFGPFAFAAVKAAICAKFVLLARALPIERRFATYPLVVPTLFRTFAFLVVVVILMFVEEAIVGLFHGRPISVSIAETGGTTEERIATGVLLFLIFMPYFAFRSLSDVMGGHDIYRLFFVRGRIAEDDSSVVSPKNSSALEGRLAERHENGQ